MTDETKVVTLHGLPASHIPNQPSPEIVKDLEELLERAKRGEIKAIAAALVKPSHEVSTMWTGDGYTNISLGYAISHLAYRYHKSQDN